MIEQNESNGIEKIYTYDALDNRKSFVLKQNGTTKTNQSYNYDNMNRLTEVLDGATIQAKYTYDAKMAAILLLNKDEKTVLLDLAAKSKSIPTVAADLPEYINEHDIVRVALRTAKEVDATDEEWQEFIERLQNRIKRTGGS